MHFLVPHVPLFCFYLILTSFVCDLLLNIPTTVWNLFVIKVYVLFQLMCDVRIGKPNHFFQSHTIRLKNNITSLCFVLHSYFKNIYLNFYFFQIHALITGPFDTPYEGGFFYFLIRCPPDYPIRPPRVKLMTTGGGQVRFNPNLYRNGKVCLSILG